jgi:hypothetical protein
MDIASVEIAEMRNGYVVKDTEGGVTSFPSSHEALNMVVILLDESNFTAVMAKKDMDSLVGDSCGAHKLIDAIEQALDNEDILMIKKNIRTALDVWNKR